MAQVTIYLDSDTEEKMRAFIASQSISQSQWVASLIREKLQFEWPEHVADLAGAWKDFPLLEEIRDELSSDSKRESF